MAADLQAHCDRLTKAGAASARLLFVCIRCAKQVSPLRNAPATWAAAHWRLHPCCTVSAGLLRCYSCAVLFQVSVGQDLGDPWHPVQWRVPPFQVLVPCSWPCRRDPAWVPRPPARALGRADRGTPRHFDHDHDLSFCLSHVHIEGIVGESSPGQKSGSASLNLCVPNWQPAPNTSPNFDHWCLCLHLPRVKYSAPPHPSTHCLPGHVPYFL